MGMGYVHTSNIAQRLSNTILVLWYKEFEQLEVEFMQEERDRNPILHQWLCIVKRWTGKLASRRSEALKMERSRKRGCTPATYSQTTSVPPY